MQFFKSSSTISVIGFLRNFTSGYSEKWSTDTSRYIFACIAFWNGPAKSIAVSWLISLVSGSLSTCFCLSNGFTFLPDSWHCGHSRAIVTTSLCSRCHQTVRDGCQHAILCWLVVMQQSHYNGSQCFRDN